MAKQNRKVKRNIYKLNKIELFVVYIPNSQVSAGISHLSDTPVIGRGFLAVLLRGVTNTGGSSFTTPSSAPGDKGGKFAS